jgi:integrase
MPRLIHRVPRLCHHKASGQATVYYHGKLHYLGRWGTPEAKQRYDEFVANLPKPGAKVIAEPAFEPAVLLVGEVAVRYQAHAEKYYVQGGVRTGEHTTIKSALTPLVARYAELPVTEFGPKALKTVREDMIKRNWSRRYCNKATSIIKRCFAWAVEEELIPAAVFHGLAAVKGLRAGRSSAREKPKVGPVSDAHLDAILPKVSMLVGDVLRTMRFSGMRPGEAISMKVSEIDRSDPACWIYRPGRHKTAYRDLGRAIPLGPRAQEIILPRLLKAGKRGLVFAITRASLRTGVLRGCNRAKIPPFTPNQIRHAVGTEVRAKYGLEAAQVLLGHAKANTTEIYAERDLSKAQEVALRIG